jgi:diadenosine tetraphosphatase ApaH/serine/threonine PP2A family protein phosphatase
LTADDVAYLRGFVPKLELRLGDEVELLAFHGSPRSFMEELLPTTPGSELGQRLDGCSAQVLAAGHTHIQMLRPYAGRLIVNPGSVGMPFLEPFSGGPPSLLAHAEWALLEAGPKGLHVGLRRVKLEREALCESAAASETPLRGWFLQQWGASP